MPGEPSLYWSPAPPKTTAHLIGRRVVHLISRLVFAYLAVALAQGIAQRVATDAHILVLIYGIGLFLTQWLSGWFLDLATSNKLGDPPGEKTSKIIYFFALALRSAPHAIFLAWIYALFGEDTVFPDPSIIAFFQITLPIFSFRKLSSPPVLMMPTNASLLLDRDSDLYQGIVNHFKPGGWLENVKYVRIKTELTPREALFLINLVHHDHKSRTSPPSL